MRLLIQRENNPIAGVLNAILLSIPLYAVLGLVIFLFLR